MSEFTITSAVLYRAGIGWFTAIGSSSNKTLYFPISNSDLDDFLKTAVISVEDGSGIKNLSFDTTTRNALFSSSQAIIGVLTYLRGSICEIQYNDQTASGKLLGFQQLDEKGKYLRISLLTDDGIATIDGYEITKITPKNEVLQQNLNEFLAGIMTERDQTSQKMLRIGLNSEDEQEVSIQFLSEMPAWKVSYRLILDPEGEDMLQIYGIVDNTTSVDFVDARLTLSTKLPVSFRYDLSSPHKISRQQIDRVTDTGITVERKKSARPVAKAMRAVGAEPQMDELADDAYMEAPTKQVQFTEQAEIEPAESVEFKLNNPVTIKKNETSMVPLTKGVISSERKVYYNKNNHAQHPFNVVEFTNTLGYALDEGPISIVNQTTERPLFQGEAMIDRIPSGEDALVLYSLERDIVIRQTTSHSKDELGFDIKDYFYRVERRNYRSYTFHIINSTSDPVDLYLAIRKDSTYELISDDLAFKESADEYRIIFQIPANTTEKVSYQLSYDDFEHTRLTNMSIKELDEILKHMDINEDEKNTITAVLNFRQQQTQYKEKLQILEKNLDRLSSRRNQIISSLDVLEEGTSDQEVRQSYVTDLTKLDTKIHTITEEIDSLEDEMANHVLEDYTN